MVCLRALTLAETHADVVRAMKKYDRLGPERFFAEDGFAPTTTYELAGEHPLSAEGDPGRSYGFATGKHLASGDFEGGKSRAVKVVGQLGFAVQEKRRSPK